MIALLLPVALAAEVYDGEMTRVDLGGDLKSFFLASFPYDHPLMPPDPTGQGVFDARLRLDVRVAGRLKFEAHQSVTALAPAGGASFGLTQSGVGRTAPELVDLSWQAPEDGGDTLLVRGRVDRLNLLARFNHLDLCLGRQPITFGKTFFFTPMDLVNPFTPATIDTEYKPGVDALRADLFFGQDSLVTAAVAYAGSWDADGLVAALYGQTTLGVWDLGVFGAMSHRDWVAGVATAGSAGPVGLRGELTATLPPEGEDPFLRAAVGGDVRPTERLSLSSELYVQTLGAKDPADYLSTYTNERFARGELWAAGRYYGALAVGVQIAPTLNGSLAAIGNLADPSAMLSGSLAWSVSDNADFAAGFYYGLGKRPADLELAQLLDPVAVSGAIRSEFGLLPATAFAQLRMYF